MKKTYIFAIVLIALITLLLCACEQPIASYTQRQTSSPEATLQISSAPSAMPSDTAEPTAEPTETPTAPPSEQPSVPLVEGLYQIKSYENDLVWTLAASNEDRANENGARFCLSQNSGGRMQAFLLRQEGCDFCRIGLYASEYGHGRVVDVYRGNDSGSLKVGMCIDLWKVSRDSDQQFIIRPQGDGSYCIILNSDQSLAITAQGNYEGAGFELATYTGSSMQKFRFDRIEANTLGGTVTENIEGCIRASELYNAIGMTFSQIEAHFGAFENAYVDPDEPYAFEFASAPAIFYFEEIDGAGEWYSDYFETGLIPRDKVLAVVTENDVCTGLSTTLETLITANGSLVLPSGAERRLDMLYNLYLYEFEMDGLSVRVYCNDSGRIDMSSWVKIF